MRVGAVFQGVRIIFALVSESAGESESVLGMAQRTIVVEVTVKRGQVKAGPASPHDDEVLTPSGVRHSLSHSNRTAHDVLHFIRLCSLS
jgi:hypothetical protein